MGDWPAPLSFVERVVKNRRHSPMLSRVVACPQFRDLLAAQLVTPII